MNNRTVIESRSPNSRVAVETNGARNKRHFDAHLRGILPHKIVQKIRNVEAFLDDATRTDTSWAALYHGNFRAQLRGARVLELGAGDGVNALVMAALGADVTCVDISEETPSIVHFAAAQLDLESSVRAISGDFVEMSFDPASFDVVVGKAFLHHLTHEQEARCLQKTATILRPDGQARFTDPAVNSSWLDACRWLVGVPGRPSRLNREAFRGYLKADPHPRRDNSSAHYVQQGARFFEHVEVVPIGGLERFHRLMSAGPSNRRFRRGALTAEHWLPRAVQMKIARAHTLILASPRQPVPEP